MYLSAQYLSLLPHTWPLTRVPSQAAHETARLVQELQTIAHQAGHPVPLLIALDQENGGVNSLFDEDYICQ